MTAGVLLYFLPGPLRLLGGIVEAVIQERSVPLGNWNGIGSGGKALPNLLHEPKPSVWRQLEYFVAEGAARHTRKVPTRAAPDKGVA